MKHEHPDVIEDGLSRELARRMADWILDKARQEESWLVGVYGERGAGKTSVLLTLLEVLENHEQVARIVLPTAENGDRSRADDRNLLKPALFRDHEELLFELLRHLDERYQKHETPASKKDNPFHQARTIEVKRKDTERFLRYEEEVGTSQEQIRENSITIHSEVASSTVNLKKQFENIVDLLRRRDEQTLVLLVDDLDLHPERALDLLEIFHIFLDQPGVVIVLAADKSLLVDGIVLSVEKNRDLKNRPDLAAALLAKYIPYEWHIPIPTEFDRFDFLWPADASGPSEPPAQELTRWWPSPTKYKTVFAEAAGENARALAKELLSRILPPTHRGLKALENRLEMVRQAFTCDEDGYVLISTRGWLQELEIDNILLSAFLSAVIAVDLQHPALMLWNHIRMYPGDMVKALEALKRHAQVDEENEMPWLSTGAPDGGQDPFEQPLLLFQRIPSSSSMKDYTAELAKQHIKQLTHIWRTLKDARLQPSSDKESDGDMDFAPERDIEAAPRFLCVSVNADAMSVAEPEWRSRFSREIVEDWHIKLVDLINAPNQATRAELMAARERAIQILREKRIASYPGSVRVFLRANLPFALWLGWELRYMRDVQAFNERNGAFTPFFSPGEKLPFDNTGRFEFMQPTRRTGEGPGQEAVLLVDPLGLSTPEKLDTFKDEHGQQVAYGPGIHLLAHPHVKKGVLPEHTEPFLRDCVEALGQLKRQGVGHVHLGLCMPDALAFLLGQQLHARVDRVSLYEYRRTRACYEYIFDLEQND